MLPTALRSFARRFPALTVAMACTLGLTLLAVLGLKVYFHSSKSVIFLLGDSGIGNYRLDPGNRLQDVLEKANPGFVVQNWAQPGASSGDCFLQLERGILLAGEPAVVVIALSPDKFLEEAGAHRFTDDGANLHWIPWNSQGLAFFQSLSSRDRNIALVQQATLPFYAVSDLAQAAWIRYVQWPYERAAMRKSGRARKERIARFSSGIGQRFANLSIGNDSVFASSVQAKDGFFLVNSLRQQRIPTVAVLLPFANPELLRRTWSPAGLAKRDLVIERMENWMAHENVAYVDFNDAKDIQNFPDAVWDDHVHLKDPQAFEYIAERIDLSLLGRKSRLPSEAASADFKADNLHIARNGAR